MSQAAQDAALTAAGDVEGAVVTHPWVVTMREAVLGPRYEIVESGFDLVLMMHRGTAHPSPVARLVLVRGVDAPGAGHATLHDMMATREYDDALPASVRKHLVCRVVETLVPVTQKHGIEGLVMGME